MGVGARAPVTESLLGAAASSLTFLLLTIAPGKRPKPAAVAGLHASLRNHQDGPLGRFRTAGAAAASRHDLRAPRHGFSRHPDARRGRRASGAIRAVNRIVSDQGLYGAVGTLPPPYGIPPPYAAGRPAYAPPEFEMPDIAPSEALPCRRGGAATSSRRISAGLRAATAASAAAAACRLRAEPPTTPKPPSNPPPSR